MISDATSSPAKGNKRKLPEPKVGDPCETTLLECVGPYLQRRMTADHPRLKRTLNDVAYLARRGSFQTAAKRFGEFRLAEERHMDLEDETLFPIIERLVGPIQLIEKGKRQHKRIRQLLDMVGNALSSGRPPVFKSAHSQLLEALTEHWDHEEELLGWNLKVPDKETVERIAGALRRF